MNPQWFLVAISFVTFIVNPAREPDGAVPPRAVVELFEDDAEGLLKLLTNPGDGPGRGEPEAKIVFSGKTSLKISEYQRFQRRLPGWDFAIREKPKPGEYRFLRLAWKSAGANCMMLQLHDATDWHLRYTAGANPYGWQTRFVADKAPATWSVVTIDLFKDFGDRTLTGIAFTIHGGAGYFDHVYLGRTVEDLDRIDATELSAKKLQLEKQDLDRLWDDLVADDAAKQYLAFWTLAAGGERSTAYLKNKLAPAKPNDAEGQQILGWIKNLSADKFSVRQKAVAELKTRLAVAAPLLEAELARPIEPEARRRIERLLADLPDRNRERTRREKAEQVLQRVAERKTKS